MTLQLTQKERLLLEDQLSHEQACIQKYSNYIQQAQDPQLKQFLNQHLQHEQQHYDTISQVLQGQAPNMAAGGQSQQPQQPQTVPMNLEVSQIDDYICNDLIMTEKYVSGAYDMTIFEATSPALRQNLRHIQQEEQQHGVELLDYLQQSGMRSLE